MLGGLGIIVALAAFFALRKNDRAWVRVLAWILLTWVILSAIYVAIVAWYHLSYE